MKTVQFKLREEWHSAQTLEDAIWTKLQELIAMAQRQGAVAPRWDRVAPHIADMFEPIQKRAS